MILFATVIVFITLHYDDSTLFFIFYCYGDHRDLHSFPTRRSSDLGTNTLRSQASFATSTLLKGSSSASNLLVRPARAEIGRAHVELQSLRHLVCRLLLEKKNESSASNKLGRLRAQRGAPSIPASDG